MKLLYLGATWPQPWITAAGLRTVDLVKAFKALDYEVEFFSIKKPNPYQMQAIKVLDVKHGFIPLNNEKDFRNLTQESDICIFETARLEEMFSHMVVKYYPNCKRIIDTQDLHCLRFQRKALLSQTTDLSLIKEMPLDFSQEDACREFAGILRSHSTILTSSHEQKMVSSLFPYSQTLLLPFLYKNKDIFKHREKFLGSSDRKNFVWIGNFMHEPNVDALDFMVKSIWPKIHSKTNAEFHIYGGHCPNEDRYKVPGVVVKGQMKSLTTLAEYRALLAYIRFGAGIKGKIADSFYHGLPVFTTSIGAEGMEPFPGFLEDDVDRFGDMAADLYDKKELYKYGAKAFDFLEEKCSFDRNLKLLDEHLQGLKNHPIQNILFGETTRSTVYFSKYIEIKNNRVV